MSSPTLHLRTASNRARATFPPIYRTLNETDPFLPYNRRIRETRRCVLEWSNSSKALQVWFWPVRDGHRVPPSELQDLRQTHNFRGPGCLCSSTTADPTAFTEAAIFLVATGSLAGQYVAACAQGSCKYWVMLERLYTRVGLPIKVYPVRAPDTTAPAAIEYRPNDDSLLTTPVTTPSSSNSSSSRRRPASSMTLGSDERPRKRARQAVIVDPFIIPNTDPIPRPRPTSAFSLLMLLDATVGAGLTYDEFRGLFVRCRGCNLIMTHRGYRDHVCPILVPTSTEIIDLTGED